MASDTKAIRKIKMNDIRLSICIPTYNFGTFIGETLKSIIDQSQAGIEVVVLDSASTDNTREVVEDFTGKYPWISYHYKAKKGGIDKDMAATVDLARGDYCWLLSSDDALKAGAIQRMLSEIQLGFDIYLCNRTECDRNLVPLRDQTWLTKEWDDHVFNFPTNSSLLEYFNNSQSIGALFSYMSSIIFKRDTWHKIKYDVRFTGSNYAHVFRLFTLLQKGSTLKYIKDSLILCRSDNDSFLEQGVFKRIMVDFDGYHLLATHLFSDKEVRRSFLSVISRTVRWHHFIAVKDMAPDGFNWADFEQKLLDFGYTRTQLLITRIVASRPILPVARYFWRLINPPKKQ